MTSAPMTSISGTDEALSTSNRLVQNLVNIGPKMTAYLAQIGITHEGQIRERGVVQTYMALKAEWPWVMNRMALYALYGALTDQNCLYLPQETQDWLEEQLATQGQAQ